MITRWQSRDATHHPYQKQCQQDHQFFLLSVPEY